MQTTSTPQDLSHYAANPDALANMSDAELDALANAPGAPAAEAIQGEKTSSETPVAASQTPEAEKPTEPTQPEGVLSRDGKHVIPYWRLADAEARAKEQAERIKELESQLATGTEKPGEAPAMLSEEELAEVERDLPAIGKLLRASQDRIAILDKAVSDIGARQQQEEQAEAAKVAEDVESAIAQTPKLAHLRATNPQGWERAVELDKVLRGKPEWQDKPFSERFAQVVKGYESFYGAIDIPGASPQDSQAVIQAKAAAALQSATQAGTAVPRSMSDIPGGSIPPVDEAAAMLAKSGPQLTADFMAMTPEQIEAKLARL